MAAYFIPPGSGFWQPLLPWSLGSWCQSHGNLSALGPVRPYSSRYTGCNPITDKLKIRFLGGSTATGMDQREAACTPAGNHQATRGYDPAVTLRGIWRVFSYVPFGSGKSFCCLAVPIVLAVQIYTQWLRREALVPSPYVSFSEHATLFAVTRLHLFPPSLH